MDLSTILLVCAIVAGLAGGFAARFRSWGTAPGDLAVGTLTASLFSTVAIVVLVLWAELNFFGFVHILYLLAVIGFPIGVAIIALPHLLNAEFKTPLIVWPLAILAVGAIGVGLWGTHVEPGRLVLEEATLGAEGANQTLVIGVIADLQTPSIGGHENDARDRVLAGEPDVVVIPGDLYQIEPDELNARLPEFLGWLRELRRSVDHVVIVNGDVDDPEVLEELAEETGALYLSDELVALDIDGQTVTFAGIALNPDADRGQISADLLTALDETTTESDLVIAVGHRPDSVLTYEAETTVDLTIAGHTHGGQVSVPGFGPPITFSDVPREVAAGGLHVLNSHPLYVSTGVGLERGQAPQLRFGVRPSVALLTVVPADG